MLWSYYKFFKPDGRSRYVFNANHDPGTRMDFEDWIARGHLPLPAAWRPYAPGHVRTDDLSGLSFEARCMNRNGEADVDEVFKIEEIETLRNYLADRTGRALEPVHSNRSTGDKRPDLSDAALAKIRTMMPYDCSLYGL
jgi:hypothetical protein